MSNLALINIEPTLDIFNIISDSCSSLDKGKNFGCRFSSHAELYNKEIDSTLASYFRFLPILYCGIKERKPVWEQERERERGRRKERKKERKWQNIWKRSEKENVKIKERKGMTNERKKETNKQTNEKMKEKRKKWKKW